MEGSKPKDEVLRTEAPDRPNIAPDRAARRREREAADQRAIDRLVRHELEFLKVSTVLQELKALALRTAVPTRWLVSVDGIEISAEPENQMVCRRPKRSGGAYRWVEGVGDYLHRFDPVMVLALLELIDELRGRVAGAGEGDIPEDESECQSCTVSASSCLYHQGYSAGFYRAGSEVKRYIDNGFEAPLPPREGDA
jgi:hypothetical protein